MPPEPALLTAEGLFKTYEGQSTPVVDGLDFAIPPGEFFTLLGPSGCGKTTTLRMIAGLERPDRGRIVLAGTTLSDAAGKIFEPPHKRDIAMVFQSYAIWPHMTVLENVLFPLETLKVPTASRDQRARAALARVGLASFADRRATLLSGGQQQRVALARAIVREAKLILLDEPLSNLDAALREQMRSELRDLQRQIGTTVVYVTHDQEEAMALSDRVAVMDAGRIVDLGTPERLFSRPATPFVARFLGSAQRFPAAIVTQTPTATTLDTPFGRVAIDKIDLPVGSACQLFIRPEHIACRPPQARATDDGLLLHGQIAEVHFFGRLVAYRVRVNSDMVEVLTTSAERFQLGQSVMLSIDRRHLMVFAEAAQ